MLKLPDARAIATEARRRLVDRIGVPDDRWLVAKLRQMKKVPDKEPNLAPRDPVLVEAFEDMWRPGEWTWEEAREAYLREVKRVRRPATHLDYSKMLSVPELARFGGKRVRRITVDDLATVVHEIHESGRERHAEHLASVLRPMWVYLAKHGTKLKSGVEKSIPDLRAPERTPGDKPRSNGKVPGGHVATPDEIGRALAIARSGAVEETIATALELLILTGQRRVQSPRPWSKILCRGSRRPDGEYGAWARATGRRRPRGATSTGTAFRSRRPCGSSSSARLPGSGGRDPLPVPAGPAEASRRRGRRPPLGRRPEPQAPRHGDPRVAS